ncbi:MAG: tRNA (adenosine(37)-N6)-threonylcarbamoyltransferase complex transferase subunit TsaD [Chloroflexi bacterium]|nr:tRNA (adenosine(37)-N6)-threonylcarbamoyltransferase complex transferase subunit TsaD [Chloroflexota bacterium]
MLVLGIETSCDEMAVALVEDGCRLRSNVIASQVELHARYGGVVPEVASRQHILQLVPAQERALAQAGASLADVDAVAATHGPGLVGSLMVGVNAAKAIAYSLEVPLIGVHHLEGHVYAAWLAYPDPARDPGFPMVCLIASGGHTDLVLMEGHGLYRVLGRTRDDAAGEAFDKAARVLGLGFPGGPAIQRVSAGVQPGPPFPRAWLEDSLDFSFSGLKTALLHRAQGQGLYPPPPEGVSEEQVASIAAAFQESLVDVMSTKAVEAADRHGARAILLGGGVAANTLLRERVRRQSPVPVLVPEPSLCTDNGAMVAAAAYFRLRRGERHALDLDVYPSLPMPGS